MTPLVLLLACRSPIGPAPVDSAPPCLPQRNVATDIDATLTLSNSEWGAQIDDPTYDPALRPDADTLMQAYADKGYTILYITARCELTTLSDGRTAFEATDDWLRLHAFPMAEDALHLTPEWLPEEQDVIDYKSGVLEARAAEGWTTDYGYGNATSDIDAWLEVGVLPENAFLVGSAAGTMEVGAIPDADAYTNHLASHVPGVPDAGCETR